MGAACVGQLPALTSSFSQSLICSPLPQLPHSSRTQLLSLTVPRLSSRSSNQWRKPIRSTDNLKCVLRTNSKPLVPCESLGLGQRGPPVVGPNFLSSRPRYSSGPPPRCPPLPCRKKGSPHTWQCLGAWLGRQSPSLDDVHFELAIPLLQADLHVPCKRPQVKRLGSSLEAHPRVQPLLSREETPFPCSQRKQDQKQLSLLEGLAGGTGL